MEANLTRTSAQIAITRSDRELSYEQNPTICGPTSLPRTYKKDSFLILGWLSAATGKRITCRRRTSPGTFPPRKWRHMPGVVPSILPRKYEGQEKAQPLHSRPYFPTRVSPATLSPLGSWPVSVLSPSTRRTSAAVFWSAGIV